MHIHKPPCMIVKHRSEVQPCVCVRRRMVSCSVEMSLLPLDEQRELRSRTDGPSVRLLTSVQLQSRRWIMRGETGEVTSEVTGEGVLGEFPILVPGRCNDTVIVTLL